MKDIRDFFVKFTKFKKPNEEIRVFSKKVIQEVINIELALEDISFRGSVINVRASGTIKNEIMLYKEKLLPRLREQFPKYRILDIQ